MRLATAGFLVCVLSSSAQTPRLEFEVASVKPVQPGANAEPAPQFGPIHFEFRITLIRLVVRAYDLDVNQIVMEDRLKGALFDIRAKAPEGTTPEQGRIMLQNLLADRFHLVAHRETREMHVWEITIAKGGLKMLDSSLNKTDDPRASPLPEQKENGPLWIAPGRGIVKDYTRSEDYLTLAAGRAVPLSCLGAFLQNNLQRPGIRQVLLDKTGLSGTYDFGMQFVNPAFANKPDAPQTSAPSIFTAAEEYLGLKISDEKRPVEMLVVDKVDKTPTEN